jgi:hypothetical protein
MNMIGSSEMIESDKLCSLGTLDLLLEPDGESKVVWVSVAGCLAGLVLAIGVIAILYRYRRLTFSSGMCLTESESEELLDVDLSLTVADPFLSEQNALSVGEWVE